MGVYVGDDLVAGNVGEVYSKAQVDAMIANAVALAEPTGSIKPFAGTTIPDGYLLCDGSAVSRTTYAALFAVIGTTYGTGDGSTTFNLPALSARVPVGAASTQYVGYTDDGQLPNIKGWFAHLDLYTSTAYADNLVFTKETGGNADYAGAVYMNRGYAKWNFNASNASSVYLDSATKVRPAGIGMYYVVKY